MICIVGAGGLGRETLDAVLARDGGGGGRAEAAVTFVDDRQAGGTVRGLPVRHRRDMVTGSEFVIGIGNGRTRRRLTADLTSAGHVPRAVLHPAAVIGPETTVGPGCIVLALAHVSSSVGMGAHVQVHYTATVGHDAVLNDFVTVLPGANVSGSVSLRPGVTVGAGAVVLPGLTIGEAAVIGAGAVVTRDVAPGVTVAGVPARALPSRP